MGNAQQYVGRRTTIGKYEVEAVKFLGEGGSSYIFLVKDVSPNGASGGHMVLKRLVAHSDAEFQLIDNEIKMHQRFKHRNVVEFIASNSVKRRPTEQEVFILMEFCSGGHLYDNMRKMGEKRFSEKELLRLFQTLCIPVALLHHEDPPIAHRDIKLENFLQAKNGVYKLCDFGSCVEGPQSLETKADRAFQSELVLKRTTAMYRSPELADVEGTAMFGAGVLTEAVDIWALGCVLFTMAYFRPPFPPDGLRTDRYTIPATPKYSSDFQTLIARMLTSDVENRANIDHVMECVEALLDNRAIPKAVAGQKPASPRKKASSTKQNPAPPEHSYEDTAPSTTRSTKTTNSKSTEARKEVPPVDLLDFDFNPTVSDAPKPAAAAVTAATTAPAGTFDPFADFSGFSAPTTSMPTPFSPQGGGQPQAPAMAPTTSAPAPAPVQAIPSVMVPGKKMDEFGFPVSPMNQAGSNPAFASGGFGASPTAFGGGGGFNAFGNSPQAAYQAFQTPQQPFQNPAFANQAQRQQYQYPNPSFNAGNQQQRFGGY